MWRKQLAVAGSIIAIAIVMTVAFASSGHKASSPQMSLELTAAESWGKQCYDTAQTLSIDLQAALKDRATMTERGAQVIAVREEACDRAADAFRIAMEQPMANRVELQAAAQRIEQYRSWVHSIAAAFGELEAAQGSDVDAALAKLHALTN